MFLLGAFGFGATSSAGALTALIHNTKKCPMFPFGRSRSPLCRYNPAQSRTFFLCVDTIPQQRTRRTSSVLSLRCGRKCFVRPASNTIQRIACVHGYLGQYHHSVISLRSLFNSATAISWNWYSFNLNFFCILLFSNIMKIIDKLRQHMSR